MTAGEAFHLVRGILLLAFFTYAILQPDKPRLTAESYRREHIGRRAIAKRERHGRGQCDDAKRIGCGRYFSLVCRRVDIH
jgi:hypothetical protein